MTTIRKSIDTLYATIKIAKEELENLRKSCEHKECEIGNYSWRPGCITETRICKECDTPLGREGSYTFIFKNIQNNRESFKKLIPKYFKYGIGIDKTGELFLDEDQNEIRITRGPESVVCLESGKGTKYIIETPEEAKKIMNEIVDKVKEIGVDVEVKNYI